MPFSAGTNRSATPVAVGSWTDWQAISLGRSDGKGCGRRASGSAWCWDESTTPTVVMGARSATQIDRGYAFACGIWDGEVFCFGQNDYGQLGVGDGLPLRRSEPTQVGIATDWSAISAGLGQTCGILGERLSCWGIPQPAVPTLLDADQGWTSVSVTGGTNVGIKNGAGYLWGRRFADDGGAMSVMMPVLEAAGPLVAIDASGEYQTRVCYVDHAAVASCWGANESGELGIGTTNQSSIPVQLRQTWLRVRSGQTHACGIGASPPGRLYCWGDNQFGQLGLGSTSAAMVLEPTPVGGFADWSDIAVGWRYTCGLRSGSVFCWGDGSMSGLGKNTPPSFNPIRLGSFEDVTALAAAGDAACLRRASGEVRCWGNNTQGRLGVGDTALSTFLSEPTVLPGEWSTIDLGHSHACGIKMDGSAWCWGANERGQLGIGPSWSSEPVAVAWPDTATP